MATFSSSAPVPSSSLDSGSNDSSSSTFIGNTPSTVLFFLALTVGIIIALLFVFFTFRYFIRTKYGLYIHPMTPNALIATAIIPSSFGGNHHIHDSNMRFTLRDLRHVRYARKKKLTTTEVEFLFPKKTYSDWLDGGQERDMQNRHGRLQEEENILKHTKSNTIEDSDVLVLDREDNDELVRTTTIDTKFTDGDSTINITANLSAEKGTSETAIVSDITDDDKPSASHGELHFTSGLCAICIDQLETSDEVRGLICGHVFHADCLDPWLTTRRACCPMCKRDYFYKDENNNSANVAGNDIENDDDTRSMNSLLDQYTPISERARNVLNNQSLSHLNIEVLAKEKADKMYRVKLRFFWKLMGITYIDLQNYSVIQVYNHMRDSGNLDIVSDSDITQGNGTSETESGSQGDIETRREMVEQRV